MCYCRCEHEYNDGLCRLSALELKTLCPQNEVEEETQCGKPCDPKNPCDECAEYWNHMEREGYWNNQKGWTEKGWREITK